jgi:hypothetical protein
MREKLGFSDVFGFISLPIWLLILEASDSTNRWVLENRHNLRICLGFAVIVLLAFNIYFAWSGIYAFKHKRSLRNFVRFALNIIQAIAIIVLVIVGIFLNGQQ